MTEITQITIIRFPAWTWMWVLASFLWICFKTQNFFALGGPQKIRWNFFLWVGTNPIPFLRSTERNPVPAAIPVNGTAFTLVGACLIYAILPYTPNSVTKGWLGLITMLCLMHFGVFNLLSWFWNRIGIQVDPIMNAPWKAETLGEFWGPRWNRAFSDWARIWLFRPLTRKLGAIGGILAGFLASGLAHELVISLPAQGGYGLPTLYFLLQGTGWIAQKKSLLPNGRLITLAVVILPAPFLFHLPFINRVFVPMIDTLLQTLHLL